MYVPERPCASWKGHADGMREHRGGGSPQRTSPLIVRVQSVRSVLIQSIAETEPGCRARDLSSFYPEVVIPSAPNRTPASLTKKSAYDQSACYKGSTQYTEVPDNIRDQQHPRAHGVHCLSSWSRSRAGAYTHARRPDANPHVFSESTAAGEGWRRPFCVAAPGAVSPR